MKREIQNFRAYPREYWQARITGADFESAMRYAEREGLQRGAAILFARHANPTGYNTWRAKQNPTVNRMAHPANKVQSFSMPRGPFTQWPTGMGFDWPRGHSEDGSIGSPA